MSVQHPRRISILPADWPYGVTNWPFFYGWVIWGVSTTGILMSLPGQTVGIAVFTDVFIGAFDLTRSELSFAYLVGTTTSAALLPYAGRLFDRFGARVMLITASLALAGTLVYISMIGIMGQTLAGWLGVSVGSVTFPLILAGYFGVRFSGQGVLPNASGNLLMLWFERRRGLVNSLRSPITSVGFSLAPLVLALAIGALGWQGALWTMALVVGVLFAGLALVTVRDRPEQCGLEPDGGPVPGTPQSSLSQRPSATAREARRSPVFWIYGLSLAMWALFGTAVTFHIVSVFAQAGRPAGEAYTYFLPQALTALILTLSLGPIADRVALKPFLILMLMALLVGTFGLTRLEADWGKWVMIGGFGVGSGFWAVLVHLAFVRSFGTLYLGEISGTAASLQVLGSAIGPFLFSLSYDQTGSYFVAYMGCGGVIAALILSALTLPKETQT